MTVRSLSFALLDGTCNYTADLGCSQYRAHNIIYYNGLNFYSLLFEILKSIKNISNIFKLHLVKLLAFTHAKSSLYTEATSVFTCICSVITVVPTKSDSNVIFFYKC